MASPRVLQLNWTRSEIGIPEFLAVISSKPRLPLSKGASSRRDLMTAQGLPGLWQWRRPPSVRIPHCNCN